MTVYSTVTYQACDPRLSDQVIQGIACKQTDQAHLYDLNKLFANLEYDLKQSSTIQIMVQNNLLMGDGYNNLPELAYYTPENNDFSLTGDLMQPFTDGNGPVYLITAYRHDNGIKKAEMVTHEAEYSPTHLYLTSNPQCALEIVGFLLSINTMTVFLKVEKTTLENAKYQVNKRLDQSEILKSCNQDLVGHAGDYWATYQLYTNCDTAHARFDYQSHYTKVQVQQALKNIKEMHPHSSPKTLVVQGCVLMGLSSQEREYKQALLDIDQPYDLDQGVIPDKDHALWVIESYKHSQSIRQAIATQQYGGHV